ncbi:unnamed protein product [Bemisia tabaci]|uniref:THAP-type domain-containing protein n=1 Tax=Bemisia tabaci TaxID=7038 RepID=A0A9P0AN85_BEMTA|nr:unnamed protein product [Bemisia tabaci]
MKTYKNYKAYCFVKECPNTSDLPEKLFFSVPIGSARKDWWKICNRQQTSLTSPHFICEDHFTLEEDVAEWQRYTILKKAGLKPFSLKLKKGVKPTKFQCRQSLDATNFVTECSIQIDFEEDPNFSEPSIKKEPMLEEPSTWQDDPCSSSTAACDPLSDRESSETTFQHQETVDSEPGGKRRRVEDVNGDAAFFESLLPLMKGFDSQKRLRFRMHVMSALARFCDPNYSHSESD